MHLIALNQPSAAFRNANVMFVVVIFLCLLFMTHYLKNLFKNFSSSHISTGLSYINLKLKGRPKSYTTWVVHCELLKYNLQCILEVMWIEISNIISSIKFKFIHLRKKKEKKIYIRNIIIGGRDAFIKTLIDD